MRSDMRKRGGASRGGVELVCIFRGKECEASILCPSQ